MEWLQLARLMAATKRAEAKRELEVAGVHVFPGQPHTYRGVLAFHWENSRIEVFFRDRLEGWHLVRLPDHPLLFRRELAGRHSAGARFEIEFEGTVDAFARRGPGPGAPSVRSVEVHRIIALEEQS